MEELAKVQEDSLPLEVFISGLNAFLAVLLPFKEGSTQGSILPCRGHTAGQGAALGSQAFLTSHITGMLQGVHTSAFSFPWHKDIGVNHLVMLGDKAACLAKALWLQFYSLLPLFYSLLPSS